MYKSSVLKMRDLYISCEVRENKLLLIYFKELRTPKSPRDLQKLCCYTNHSSGELNWGYLYGLQMLWRAEVVCYRPQMSLYSVVCKWLPGTHLCTVKSPKDWDFWIIIRCVTQHFWENIVFETSDDFHCTTLNSIPEDRNFRGHYCRNPKSNTVDIYDFKLLLLCLQY
jgi:hypothetical protein